ncbi:hypothetical protein OM076_15655 [Solirubrobacter ginsenosidimutans]|uniref:RNA polymerase sigma-70 region 2 domain-containing protein n=1 Tax=Solirubrobacter ginsenosidimutans TaxID=490573 RepID=A0A9X3S5L0_9ACTN|nr:sigma factor [Solirubrobacter ginsenosidimutans]MDA0161713.1 hypothetical protein [Solirubrobacter ginsenosidimutans]
MADDDAELLRRLRAGDERAFGEIVREWSPLMLRVADTFVTTYASAEECVQEAWLAVIRGLDGFEGRSRLRTWVVGIVVNIARRRAERDGRVVRGRAPRTSQVRPSIRAASARRASSAPAAGPSRVRRGNGTPSMVMIANEVPTAMRSAPCESGHPLADCHLS